MSAAIDSEHKTIAIACRAPFIVVRNLEKAEQFMIQLPSGWPIGLAFTDSGRILRAACFDGSVREFQIDSMKFVPREPHSLRQWLIQRSDHPAKSKT